MAAFAAFLAPFFWWTFLTSNVAEGAILDPSLYLLPSPPLTHDDPIAWTDTTRVTRDAAVDTNTIDIKPTTLTQKDPDPMEGAETIWPSLRPAYGLGGVHIPLTFSLTGTYGSGHYGSGVVGSNYGNGAGVASIYSSITADEPANSFGSYGKSALAGSSYGTYGSGYPGVRLFGSSVKTGWSGWGNGKWGNYGKG